jgi:hypothetical protein
MTTLVLHVTGPATGATTSGCFLRLPAHLAGGGTMTYCLKTFAGAPGPNRAVNDSGVLTFSLPRGRIVARVSIEQRFGADGRHARQTLTGTIVGGSGAYAHARGTITGGGTDVEDAPGHIASSDLRYRLSLR